MAETGRDRIAVLLADAAGPAAFSAARTAPTNDLQLEVRGVGPIKLPVSQAQAKQLCVVGRRARYGRAEQTLLDRRVRDTWEIPKSRVNIDKRRFDKTLVPLLERLARDLGLPSGPKLTAELHSMLVYAAGQFFVTHQDSEKDDAMIGTLVLGLPSTFKGGTLEVRHAGQRATYRGSKKALSFVAFYGDCHHQVKPVSSGHRVVLTYNLLLCGARDESVVDADPQLIDGLARSLEDHFAPAGGPKRLVYLLDHEYTRRGLDWSRLKGADARKAPPLVAAAERSGCDAVLALADVHETWTAYERDDNWGGRWRDRGGSDWYDDSDDFDDSDDSDDSESATSDDYELDELIESEVTLDGWIDRRSGRLVNVNLTVGDDELSVSTASGELEPYLSEYEGYMGNWGNTLDRWYHRGAVVVWPRSRAFAVMAEASPRSALDELLAQIRTGELTKAREAAATMTPFWGRVATQVGGKAFFTKTLRTARLIDEPALAAMLLAPFRLEELAPTHAKALAALVDSYGERWAGEVVSAWSASRGLYETTNGTEEAWVGALPRLCQALREAEDAGTFAARLLLSEAWRGVRQAIDWGLQPSPPSQRERALSELGRPIAALLEAAAEVGAADLRDEAVRLLHGEELAGCAVAVLRASPPSRWSAVGLDVLATHCSWLLEARLARPARAANDWSIELPTECGCALCDQLRAFLADPTETRLEWRLAKDSRRHVHGRIDTAELPVTHATRRVGRPYTLILTKSDALFERERRERRRYEQDRGWLRQAEQR